MRGKTNEVRTVFNDENRVRRRGQLHASRPEDIPLIGREQDLESAWIDACFFSDRVIAQSPSPVVVGDRIAAATPARSLAIGRRLGSLSCHLPRSAARSSSDGTGSQCRSLVRSASCFMLITSWSGRLFLWLVRTRIGGLSSQPTSSAAGSPRVSWLSAWWTGNGLAACFRSAIGCV